MGADVDAVYPVPVKLAVAATAARAAAAVPGVVRLEPGLSGLLARAARDLHRRITGVTPSPTDGVRVAFDRGAAKVEVDVVVSARLRTADVGAAVRREVVRVLVQEHGLAAPVVRVNVLDIVL